MRRGDHIFILFPRENIRGGKVTLGVTMLTRLGYRDTKNLARVSLDHHVAAQNACIECGYRMSRCFCAKFVEVAESAIFGWSEIGSFILVHMTIAAANIRDEKLSSVIESSCGATTGYCVAKKCQEKH